MRFTHSTRKPEFVLDRTRTYDMSTPAMKPVGLWLSVDDDWQRWCLSDTEWWDDYQTHIEFDVDLERCLVLDDIPSMLGFTLACVGTWREGYSERFGVDHYRTRWDLVAERFAGIVIAPYHWELRLSVQTSWYYPWDAASACIWDLSVISDPRPYKPPERGDPVTDGWYWDDEEVEA